MPHYNSLFQVYEKIFYKEIYGQCTDDKLIPDNKEWQKFYSGVKRKKPGTKKHVNTNLYKTNRSSQFMY